MSSLLTRLLNVVIPPVPHNLGAVVCAVDHAELRAIATAQSARLDAVMALHDTPDICDSCLLPTPCPTYRALTGGDQ